VAHRVKSSNLSRSSDRVSANYWAEREPARHPDEEHRGVPQERTLNSSTFEVFSFNLSRQAPMKTDANRHSWRGSGRWSIGKEFLTVNFDDVDRVEGGEGH
jgi:hypothetical protein